MGKHGETVTDHDIEREIELSAQLAPTIPVKCTLCNKELEGIRSPNPKHCLYCHGDR